MNKAIFIGGVHGAGKTTSAARLSQQLNINSYGCCEIIASMKKGFFDNENKYVPDVREAQELLIRGIEQKIKDEKYVLDGHFCVVNSGGVIEIIPIDVFEKLKILEIIVITRDPKIIAESTEVKDRKKYGEHFIDLFQKIEIEYAKYIAKELGVPITICDANDDLILKM